MGEPENDTTSLEKLQENLQKQLDEIEMLESIFPKEFKFEEGTNSDCLRNYLEGKTNDPPPFIDFTINVTNDQAQKFEMCVTLSQDYPNALPDIYLRHSEMSRTQASALNKACCDYLATLERGEPCIYSAVVWLQESAQNFTTNIVETKSDDGVNSSEKLVRYWIYSHHIYNKTKRREILYLAGRLNITGFCMPGKPGIICVEGHESDCSQWWASIRSMTWQKIMCKVTEDAKSRRFQTFQEVPFQTHGSRSNHSDLGELYKYLQQHQLEFIFKELFGIEGGK